MKREQKRVAIYTRVSTGEQSVKPQEKELRDYAAHRGWVITQHYSDTISGAKESRPGLDQLMTDCKKRKADVVLVWKFDRFARSVSHLLRALETFEDLGVEFVSLSEQIDTSTPAGRMIFTVLGAVSALERSLIGERVRLGIQNARREGKQLGRPAIKRLSDTEIRKIKAERRRGVTLKALSTQFGASMWAVYQAGRQ